MPRIHSIKIKDKSDEESLDAFFNFSPIGFVRTDKNGNIKIFNSSLLKILGFGSHEELMTVNYLLNKFRNNESELILAGLIQKSEDFIFESNWKKKNGLLAYTKEYFRVVRGENADIKFLDISVEETTDKKRIERTLQIAEEKFKTIIDQVPVGIYRTISTGEIIFANSYFARILGYESTDEIKGKNFGNFLSDPGEYDKTLNYHIAMKRSSFSNENVMVRKDGKNIWVRDTSNLIYDTSNELLFFEGILEDITAKKNAEDELSRLFVAINQISEGIVITNIESEIVYANPAFEKITLYNFDEVRGKKISILKSGQHSKEFYKKMLSTIHAGENWSGRIVNKKKNGLIYEEQMVISPIKNQDGQIINFVAVKRDVTEERKIEQHINQSKKLQAIGTLAGGIAHDFNNILMGMQIFTEILLKKISDNSIEHGILKKVYSAQIRAKDLIKQLLSFSRQSGDYLEPLQIHLVVLEAIKLIQSTFPQTLKLEIKINDCGYVNGNATHIHQIIMNLCNNANQAMEGNGLLTVGLEKVDFIENPDGNKIHTNSNWVQLTVKDTGCGIEKKVRDRIFEPFFTTKSVGQGLGLGLATVHGIVKQYGGEIFFHSEVGSGTVFYLYLPAL